MRESGWVRWALAAALIAGCGRAEQEGATATGGATTDTDAVRAGAGAGGESPTSGGSAATGGGFGSGGTTIAGGATGEGSASPCSAKQSDPAVFCVTSPCLVSRVTQFSCEANAGAFTLALGAESSELGFAAYAANASAWQFEVATWKHDALTRSVATGVELGWVLASPAGLRRIGKAGGNVSWLHDDLTLGDSIAVPEGLIHDVWLDANEVAHFLVVGEAGLEVASSDGTIHHIAERSYAFQRLTPTTPVGVIAAEQGQFRSDADTTFRLLHWDLAGGTANVLASFESEPPVATFAQAEGSRALSLDTYGAGSVNPAGLGARSAKRLLFLNDAGESSHAWQNNLTPFACSGAYTAYAPDICKTTTRTQASSDGSPIGLHAVARTQDGSLWLARLSGPVDSICGWSSINACIETIPCSCAERQSDDYRLELALYRAPDFVVPEHRVRVPIPTVDASLVMKSRGSTLSIVVGNRLSNGTSVTWFEVETTPPR